MPLDDHTPHQAATNEECLAALRDYQTQKRACDEANGVLRSLVKRYKAGGICIPALLRTARAVRRDPDEVIMELREQVRMMQLRRIQVTKFNLFPEDADLHVAQAAQAEEDMWSAEDAGYRAGRNGVPVEDCPYDLGTEKQVRWLDWWHKGQASKAMELGENARQADASRERPASRAASPPPARLEGPRKSTARKTAARPATGGRSSPRKAANGKDAPAAAAA